jgi:restriction system protein
MRRALVIQLSGSVKASGSVSAELLSVTPSLVGLNLTGVAPTVQIRSGVGSAAGSGQARAQGIAVPHLPPGTEIQPPQIDQDLPDVLLQAVVHVGAKTSEGQLIAGVAIAWFEIAQHLKRDPAFLYRIGWRQLEELVAGAYERDGWSEVVLTPRSRDGGRDIIATKAGVGSVRILDQIKAYHAGHLVGADEVRAMLGVLAAEQNVSKGLVTTTSSFAPGIEADARLARFMPYRLELKKGQQLLEWLADLAGKKH